MSSRRSMRVNWRSASTLTPHPKNPKQHPEEQVAEIARSIERYGWGRPVIIDEDSLILAGHGAVLAALAHKWEVPTVQVREGLTADEKFALLVADNKTGEHGEWDMDLLNAQLDDIIERGELEAFDFGLNDDDMLALGRVEGAGGRWGSKTDEDEIPPAPPPVSVVGDVWHCGNHRVVCMDSTSPDLAEHIADASVGVAFTSLPYGVGLDYNAYEDTFDNLLALLDGLLPSIDRMLNAGAMATFNFMDVMAGRAIVGCDEVTDYPMGEHYWSRARALGWTLHTHRIWAKPFEMVSAPWTANSSRASGDWEHLWTFKKAGKRPDPRHDLSPRGVWDHTMFKREGAVLHDHPGAFPVYLPRAGLEVTARDGDLVLDPCGGNGTTMIAATLLGLDSVSVEIDPVYVDIIVKRWQNFTGMNATRADGMRFDDATATTTAAA